MTQTINSVQPSVWTDVYAATGIQTTTPIKIQTIGDSCYVTSNSLASLSDVGEVVAANDVSEVYVGTCFVRSVNRATQIVAIEQVATSGGGGAAESVLATITNPHLDVHITDSIALAVDDSTPISVHFDNTSIATTVTSIPSVTIGSMPQVVIDDTTPVDVHFTNTSIATTVTNTPTVNVGSLPNVTVSDTTPVRTQVIGSVGVSSLPNVTVNDTTPVRTQNIGTASVSVTNTPTVNIGAMPQVILNASNLLDVNIANAPLPVQLVDSLINNYPVSVINGVTNGYTEAIPIKEVDPVNGNTKQISVFGEAIQATRQDYISVQFQYGPSAYDTVSTVTGTGAITGVNSMASISAGTGVGSAKLQSKAAIRYFPGHEFFATFSYMFQTPQANTEQLVMLGDETDGFGIGYVGTAFYGVRWSGGVRTLITASPPTYTNKLNVYGIRGGWLGAANVDIVRYESVAQLDRWQPVAGWAWVNTNTVPHILNASLPITSVVRRTSGTGTALTNYTASWVAGTVGSAVIGGLNDRMFMNSSPTLAYTATMNMRPLLTLRNESTFNGKINHVRIRYGTVDIASDGAQMVDWTVIRNGTLTGASFTSVDTDSCCSVDVAATAITGGKKIGATITEKVEAKRLDFTSGTVVLAAYPGETITLCAQSTGNTTLRANVRDIEEF